MKDAYHQSVHVFWVDISSQDNGFEYSVTEITL